MNTSCLQNETLEGNAQTLNGLGKWEMSVRERFRPGTIKRADLHSMHGTVCLLLGKYEKRHTGNRQVQPE